MTDDWRGEHIIAIPHRPKSHKSEASRRDAMMLGQRRWQVIQHFRKGKSRAEIAESLGVSKSTVQSDLRLLGVKDARAAQ